MKEIIPYSTSAKAIALLDNGGRFFNVFTKKDDGIISKAELSKVAGLLSGKQEMILHLEMLVSRLNDSQKDMILSKLDETLKRAYQKYQPKQMGVAEAIDYGQLSTSVIISGVPKMVDSKTEFNGFIMIPIMTGKVTTFSMIPIIDQLDVYEVRDEISDKKVIIAHAKGHQKLPEKRLSIGGVLKELKASEKEKESTSKYLETYYHSMLK